MEVPNKEKYAILDSIERQKGRGLLQKPEINQKDYSIYLLQLEDENLIKIEGKVVYEGPKVEYEKIELTQRGLDLYKWFLKEKKII